MKTLSDLKKNASLYEWELISNSWFKELPKFQRTFRKVGRTLSSKFSLLTDKNNDGKLIESWIDFPKASELQILKMTNDETLYTILIKRDCGKDQPIHEMTYLLKKSI